MAVVKVFGLHFFFLFFFPKTCGVGPFQSIPAFFILMSSLSALWWGVYVLFTIGTSYPRNNKNFLDLTSNKFILLKFSLLSFSPISSSSPCVLHYKPYPCLSTSLSVTVHSKFHHSLLLSVIPHFQMNSS